MTALKRSVRIGRPYDCSCSRNQLRGRAARAGKAVRVDLDEIGGELSRRLPVEGRQERARQAESAARR